MNQAIETIRRTVAAKLDAALTQHGVLQEILLLRLLNGVIGQFAATASDWRSAPALESRQWREQIRTLLETLDFMIASADSYAPETTGLADDVAQLTAHLAASDHHWQELTTRKTALTAALSRTQANEISLQREVELLQTLKELAPFRAAMTARVGEQRLQALADGELARTTEQQRQQAEQLAHHIDRQLAELETLLRQDLTLAEQEWAALRSAVTHITGI